MVENKLPTIEDWKKAFAKAAAIAIDKDYFSDIIQFELFPKIDFYEDEENAEKIWTEVEKQFESFFGYNYHDLL